jgi:hypothetical protein
MMVIMLGLFLVLLFTILIEDIDFLGCVCHSAAFNDNNIVLAIRIVANCSKATTSKHLFCSDEFL